MVRFIAISSFMGQKVRTVARNEYITVADLRGGPEGHTPGGPKSYVGAPPRGLAPPPHGNPGSATA